MTGVGWLDNLDEALTLDKVKSTIRKREIREARYKSKESELEKAVRVFSERVTMTGVNDIYRSKVKFEKWTFISAISLAWFGIIFNGTRIVRQAIDQDTVYDRFPMINYQPPFPNVSICAPLSMNRSLFEKWLVIPVKTHNLIKRKHINLTELIDFTFELFRYDLYPRVALDPLLTHASLDIMDATVVQFERGYADFLAATLPECQEILINCSFNDHQFDCCKRATFLYAYDRICYEINVNSIPGLNQLITASGGMTDDPIHLDTSGLVINVTFDFSLASFFEDVAQDGFHVTVGVLPFSHSHPVSVPSGADALITVAATKHIQLTQCVAKNRLPKMQFFDYYDPTGELYFYDTGPLHMAVDEAGCDFALLTHRPSPDIPYCMPIFYYRLKTPYDGMDISRRSKTRYQTLDVNTRLVKQFRAALPVCERWHYEVKSASYGYIQRKNQGIWNQQNEPITKPWSRLRIFFPAASYLLKKEKPADSPYLTVSRVGSLLSAYIGVSVIGLGQLIFYGSIVCYFITKRCRKRFD